MIRVILDLNFNPFAKTCLLHSNAQRVNSPNLFDCNKERENQKEDLHMNPFARSFCMALRSW